MSLKSFDAGPSGSPRWQPPRSSACPLAAPLRLQLRRLS
jgi:hypothetical protein